MIEDDDEEDDDEGPAPSSGEFLLASRHLGFMTSTLPYFLISEAPSRSLSPAPSTSPPPPEETPVASSSKAISRRLKAESQESKSTIKAKGKTKTKAKAKVGAPAAVEGEDVEMHNEDKEAVEPKGSDPPEEDNDSGEDELEDVEERKAASKRCVQIFLFQPTLYAKLSFHSAEVALDRRDEMDVEGWKVGDPYGPVVGHRMLCC